MHTTWQGLWPWQYLRDAGRAIQQGLKLCKSGGVCGRQYSSATCRTSEVQATQQGREAALTHGSVPFSTAGLWAWQYRRGGTSFAVREKRRALWYRRSCGSGSTRMDTNLSFYYRAHLPQKIEKTVERQYRWRYIMVVQKGAHASTPINRS